MNVATPSTSILLRARCELKKELAVVPGRIVLGEEAMKRVFTFFLWAGRARFASRRLEIKFKKI